MKALAAAALLAALAVGCAAPEPKAATSIGVVVLHDRASDPYGPTLRFTRAMQREGFMTDSPEMPWSARRSSDARAGVAAAEIDAAVARLRSRDAKQVFLAGHGMGASAALRYAKERRVDGLIALAPDQASASAAAVRLGTPVLWVVGDTEDALLKKSDQAGFEALPRNPPPKFVEVSAGHLDTPDAATKACADWIREVANK